MMNATDIAMIKAEIRATVIEELGRRVEIPRKTFEMQPISSGGVDGVSQKVVDNSSVGQPLKQPFPFEIVVELDPDTSVPTVYVRNGAFVINETDGTHKFVATNELTSEAAYTLYEVPNTIAADKTIWAKLDMSSTEPVATIVTTQPTDDPDVFYVCIGKVNAEGGIEQYVFGHIPYGGGSGSQLDHSFLPTQLTASTAQVTPGTIYDRFGTGHDVSTATDWPVGGVIDFSIDKRFYVQINYKSSPPESIGQFQDMQWKSTLFPFPTFRSSEFTENIPIIEFPSNTWASLIRRQTSCVYLNAYRHNSLANLLGGLAPNDFYHLTNAQVELIDTHLPLAYQIQDPDQPWPGDEYPIQDPDEPWPVNPDNLSHYDLVDLETSDDHGGVSTTAEGAYVQLIGAATRNAMSGEIGDGGGVQSIDPTARTLDGESTAGEVGWKVTSTADVNLGAGAAKGALVVAGGITSGATVMTTNLVAKTAVYCSGTADATEGTPAIDTGGGVRAAKKVQAGTNFMVGAVDGITKNVTWEDVNGQVHTLAITGGIITAHTVA